MKERGWIFSKTISNSLYLKDPKIGLETLKKIILRRLGQERRNLRMAHLGLVEYLIPGVYNLLVSVS